MSKQNLMPYKNTDLFASRVFICNVLNTYFLHIFLGKLVRCINIHVKHWIKIKEGPPHQSKQVEEEVGVFSEDVEGLATEIHK